ncbi:MAG: tetratricopeptide repeat protein [Bacteroidales bacterium]|jgi:tetratricopeptide (TPR) repeat protein|nr:tetratricopeptide repeat protein [Bacteroidales bacterium]
MNEEFKENEQLAEEWFLKGIAAFDTKGYDIAIECFKKAIELEPDYAYAYNGMGNAYSDWNGNYKNAIECYKKAIELNPDYADAYYNMGNAYGAWNGQYEKAIECYEKAIELDPDYAEAYNNMKITRKKLRKLTITPIEECRDLLKSIRTFVIIIAVIMMVAAFFTILYVVLETIHSFFT